MSRFTLTSLTKDLLDAYAFLIIDHDISISYVRVHVGSTRYAQPYSSHHLDHVHSGSAHQDPPTNQFISLGGRHYTSPLASAGH